MLAEPLTSYSLGKVTLDGDRSHRVSSKCLAIESFSVYEVSSVACCIINVGVTLTEFIK